jgi:multiple sugar transport system permease protein
MWLLRAYFASIPTELDEAARIDGASWLKVFHTVILPLATPGIATAAIFTFINSWNEFMYTSIFINNPEKMTLPFAIYSYMVGQLVRWKPLLAAAVMVTIPIFIAFVVMQKAIIRGLTAGALKG